MIDKGTNRVNEEKNLFTWLESSFLSILPAQIWMTHTNQSISNLTEKMVLTHSIFTSLASLCSFIELKVILD